MYNSNISCDLMTEIKSERTEIIWRLSNIDFTLIPAIGKKTCVKWKAFQRTRVTPNQISEWLKTIRFENFVLLTGSNPWSDLNPGIVVLDADDDAALEVLRRFVPTTPMMQTTGSGTSHWVFRHPGKRIACRTKTMIDGVKFNLDLKADGGYVLAPGSIHPTTKCFYEESAPWTLDLLNRCPVYDPRWLPIDEEKKISVFANGQNVDGHSEKIEIVEMPMAERQSIAKLFMNSVNGTREGTGADNRCTALTMDLLYGFALSVEHVRHFLVAWGSRQDQLDKKGNWFPWSEQDITRKIEWCLNQIYRGEVGDKLHRIMNPKNPLEIAKHFFDGVYQESNKGTLIHHRGEWHHWNGDRYVVVSEDDIRTELYLWLAKCKVAAKDQLVPMCPNRSIVSGMVDALKAVCNQSSNLVSPCWLRRQGPTDIIAFKNGLFEIDSGELHSHTPDWFSPNCLPHCFLEGAECPEWLQFLNDVFDGDQGRIRSLQQWFGYNLINDSRMHKMALLIGPPRSGKGTSMAVLSALLGRHNVANISLSSLGGRFGLEPLVGKMAALIDEGHLGRFSDNSLILERIKAITGGSEQAVDRKGLPAISNVRLPVRFTMAVNELPRLSDSSAAMRARLLVIPYFNTYEGQEDFELVDRLLAEVSGITNWALEGLRDLTSFGRFKNPSAGEAILRDFVHLSSPVKSFLDECCIVGSEQSVSRSDLQIAWQIWCEQQGHMKGSNADFGKKLRAAVPRIQDKRTSVDGKRVYRYFGVGINNSTSDDIERRNLGG